MGRAQTSSEWFFNCSECHVTTRWSHSTFLLVNRCCLSLLKLFQVSLIPIRSLWSFAPCWFMVIPISDHKLLILLHRSQSPDAFDRSKTRVSKPAPKSKALYHFTYTYSTYKNHNLPKSLLEDCFCSRGYTHWSYLQLGVKEWFALWPKDAQYLWTSSKGWGTSITVSSSSEIVLPFRAQSLLSTWWHN